MPGEARLLVNAVTEARMSPECSLQYRDLTVELEAKSASPQLSGLKSGRVGQSFLPVYPLLSAVCQPSLAWPQGE